MSESSARISEQADSNTIEPLRSVLLRYSFLMKKKLLRLGSALDFPVCGIVVPSAHFMHVVSVIGTDITIIHREHAFSNHLVGSRDAVVIEDCTKDALSRDNPYVLDGPKCRSYLAVPLDSMDGERLGSVCIMDVQPRKLSYDTRMAVKNFAHTIARTLQEEVDETRLLRGLDSECLLQLLRAEPRHNEWRLVQLSHVLHARYD